MMVNIILALVLQVFFSEFIKKMWPLYNVV